MSHYLCVTLLFLSALLNAQDSFSVTAETTPANCGQANGQIQVLEDSDNTFPGFGYEVLAVRSRQVSPIFDSLAAGMYTVVGYDTNGNNDTIFVTVPEAPVNFTLFPILLQGIICPNEDGAVLRIDVSDQSLDYEFQVNLGEWQADSIFEDLPAGITRIAARIAGTDCTISSIIPIPSVPSFNFMSTTTNASCGEEDGSITVSIQNISLDEVTFGLVERPGETGPSFTGLGAGTYHAYYLTEEGCRDTIETVVPNPGVNFTLFTEVVQQASCGGSQDAAFYVGINGGTGDFEFRVNEGEWQTDSLFSGYAPGSYTIQARIIASTCSVSSSVSLEPGEPLDIGANTSPANCGIDNGTITVIPDEANTSEFVEYTLVGTQPYQLSPLFSGLATGTYQLVGRTAEGCTDTVAVEVPQSGTSFRLFPIFTRGTSCPNDTGNVLRIDVDNRTADYEFRINNGLWQTDSIFTGLGPGNYLVMARIIGTDCTESENITTPEGLELIFEIEVEAANCSANDGRIELALRDFPPSRVSFGLTELPNASGPSFDSLPPGIYSAYYLTDGGCSDTIQTVVPEVGPTISVTTTLLSLPLCTNESAGSFSVEASGPIGNEVMEFSLSGAPYSSQDTFRNLGPGSYILRTRLMGSTCIRIDTVNLPSPSELTIAPQIVPTDCSGQAGQVTLDVLGGTDEYMYSLNGGMSFQDSAHFTQLMANTYAAVVRSNSGCETSLEVTVPNGMEEFAAEIVAALPPTCVNDADGSASVLITNGAGPYFFNWSDGSQDSLRNNLPNGDYLVTVSNEQGCETILTFSLNRLPVTIEAVVRSLSCNTESSIELTASGGSGEYRYLWSDGVITPDRIDLPNGQYAVTVTDTSGCIASEIYEIDQTSPLFIPFRDTLICRGTALTVTPSFPIQNVEWRTEDGVVLGLEDTLVFEGTSLILVAGTDANGCSFSDSFSVGESEEAMISRFLLAGQAIVGDTVILVENSTPAPKEVDWFFVGPGAVNYISDSLNQYSYSFSEIGIYSVTLYAAAGACESSITKTIEILPDSTTLMPQPGPFSEITLFRLRPNPTIGPAVVEVNLSDPRTVNLRVYDFNGIMVTQARSSVATEHQFNLDLSGRQSGTYLVSVDTGTEVRFLPLILQ